MSDDTTARLTLPLLHAGQAQKETTHNEALAILDLAVAPAVTGVTLDAPPADPVPGQCWIVGPAPTGAWAGHPGAIAGWTAGGWRFVAPRVGMTAWDVAASRWLVHDGVAWESGVMRATRMIVDGVQVVGSRQAAIADATGGVGVDAEARSALSQILSALRTHGLIAP